MAKTKKCSPAVIATCKWGRTISYGCSYCDYLDKHGHSRGCPPDACDKYEKKAEGKKKCL